jgi:hypothetical protein
MGRLAPDRVGDWILPVCQPSHSLSERQGRPFGVGEVGSLPPSGYSEEALIGFTGLLAPRAPESTQKLQPLI